jgi:hypothetical protein
MMTLLLVLQMSLLVPPMPGTAAAEDLHVRFWQGTGLQRIIVGELRLPVTWFTCQLPLTAMYAMPLPLLPAPQWLAFRGEQTECRTTLAGVAWPTLGTEVEARFVGGGVDGPWNQTMPVRALAEEPPP